MIVLWHLDGIVGYA